MRRLLVKTFLTTQRMLAAAGSLTDHYYLDRTASASDEAWVQRIVAECNRPGMCVLEIGSREVTGPSSWRPQFNRARYVGFDFHPGPNVDVVGDAHRLSTHFADVVPFDAVLSVATFEHLATPWVVATEIARVLRV